MMMVVVVAMRTMTMTMVMMLVTMMMMMIVMLMTSSFIFIMPTTKSNRGRTSAHADDSKMQVWCTGQPVFNIVNTPKSPKTIDRSFVLVLGNRNPCGRNRQVELRPHRKSSRQCAWVCKNWPRGSTVCRARDLYLWLLIGDIGS